MPKPILLVVLALLGACDLGPKESAADRAHERAANTALSCITQSASCEDWKPQRIDPLLEKPGQEDCEPFLDPEPPSGSPYLDGKNYSECLERNVARMAEYKESRDQPLLRSPCQMRMDACVQMVTALAGVPRNQHVTNHIRQD